MQAPIAACHASASDEDTTGPDHGPVRGAGAREALGGRRAQSGRCRRPVPRSAAGLALVDEITAAGDLASYPQLSAVRADLLEREGRSAEAAAAYRRAAEA